MQRKMEMGKDVNCIKNKWIINTKRCSIYLNGRQKNKISFFTFETGKDENV